MKKALNKTRQARKVTVNLMLLAFFVWIMVSLLQPVSINHQTAYADHNHKNSFELVELNHKGNRQEITYYNNESQLRFQSK